MDGGIPWSWIWFFAAVITFAMGFLLRDDIRKLFESRHRRRRHSDEPEKPDEDPLPPKPEATDDVGMCTFENEDVMLKMVYDYQGNLVSKNKQVQCSDCNQYIFKDQDGCVPYGFNRGSMAGKVCTAGTYVDPKEKVCRVNGDCLDNARCVDIDPTTGKGFCQTWMIPESKVCPFQ